MRAIFCWLLLTHLLSGQTPPTYDFVTNGIQSAKVLPQNGVPVLTINGQAVPPLMFTYQGLRSNPTLYWTAQAGYASTHGIHIYGIEADPIPWGNGQGGAPTDYTAVDQRIQQFLAADPKGVFLLRVGVWPGPGWAPAPAPAAADNVTKYDGTLTGGAGNPSIGSDIYANGSLNALSALAHHIESSPLASHVLGYIVGGQNTGEWFPYLYRENGPDYSATNLAKFRSWLTAKYGTDAALSQAWGKSVTLTSAQIPLIDPTVLPLGSTPSVGQPMISFYSATEQDWVDFSQYTSDSISQRILDIAQTLRTATQGKRLIGFYFGYSFELPASYNGHLRLDRLLSSPNIDIVCSPISYVLNIDRMAGGPADQQHLRDSIAAHGKLQIAEDDLRTYLGQAAGLPDLGYNGGVATSGFAETYAILKRNLASAMVHRSGTWWMDLNEVGAFGDSRFWQVMTDGLNLYNATLAAPVPYKPEVALIVDPSSIAYEKDIYDVNVAARLLVRNGLARTGASSGLYLLDDFINGVVPKCKIYIFATAWYLSDAQITAIQGRLKGEGSTVLWLYAPGYLGGSTWGDETRVSRVTGITVKRVDGQLGTQGTGLITTGWGWPYKQNVVSPRFTINDSSATILGNYFSDQMPSAAEKTINGYRSIYFADLAPEVPDANGSALGDILRPVLKSAGVHIWADNNEIIHTDGKLLAINRATAGVTHIHLPVGIKATPMEAEPVTASGDGIDVTFAPYETRYFTLGPAPAISAVVPNSGQQGQAITNVVVTGMNTSFAQSGISASFGAGISVNSITVMSATSASVSITIAPSAAIGVRDVSVTAGSETATLASGFNVTAGTPTLLSISANSGAQGATLNNVIITGQFTNFTNSSSVSLGAGITVSNVNASSTTSMTVTLGISAGAATGQRNLTVDGVTLTNAFNVTAGSAVFTARLNAGGTVYNDPQGNLWSPDPNLAGTQTFFTQNPIRNTSTPYLYQSERFSVGTAFQYLFGSIANGAYNVRLKFAETYFTRPGQRVFNVNINGNPALTNFDIVAAAGGSNTAIDTIHSVNVTNGQITIQFVPVVSNPKISAIEILPQTVAIAIAPGITDPLPANAVQQFTATVAGSANHSVNWTLSPNIGNITAAGVYTAAQVTNPTKVIVTAVSQADNTQTASSIIQLVPQPWASLDIGAVNLPGSSTYSGNAFNLQGSGDLFGASDALRYTYNRLSGDGTIVARVNQPYVGQTKNKSGVMLRYDLRPVAAYGFTGLYSAIVGLTHWRSAPAGTTSYAFGAAGIPWVRLTRTGSTVSSYVSNDATSWIPVGAPQTLYSLDANIGLAVSNGYSTSPDAVTFDNVDVSTSPVSVAINEGLSSLAAGQQAQFTANVIGTVNSAVTWSISPAGQGVIDPNTGVYTAPASISPSPQTVTITATSLADPTQSASIVVLLGAFQPIRVNCGGPTHYDPTGVFWYGDLGAVGGREMCSVPAPRSPTR